MKLSLIQSRRGLALLGIVCAAVFFKTSPRAADSAAPEASTELDSESTEILKILKKKFPKLKESLTIERSNNIKSGDYWVREWTVRVTDPETSKVLVAKELAIIAPDKKLKLKRIIDSLALAISDKLAIARQTETAAPANVIPEKRDASSRKH
jgi:hypothetical protein